MPQFMLVLRDLPKDFQGLGPEEMQRIIEKYVAWSARMQSQGRLVGSNKLADQDGRVLRRERDRLTVKDGPFVETKEVVSGYYVIRARDYDEAVELCRDHPHLEFSGPIELRQVDLMGGPES
jgi:hypothetical protein